MHSNFKEDFDSLNKLLYLDNPDLWMDFNGRDYENKCDELLLFLCSKFNYLNIIKYTLDNNLIDLYSPSENKEFNNIFNHLLYISKQYNNTDIYNYLISVSTFRKQDNRVEGSTHKDTTKGSNSIPTYLCAHCNSNIFKNGFVIRKDTVFEYSREFNSPIEISTRSNDNVICNTCKKVIPNITFDKLESICNINNCSNCSQDLRVSGIINKSSMIFDKQANTFVLSDDNFVCSNCDCSITEDQLTHFNLI